MQIRYMLVEGKVVVSWGTDCSYIVMPPEEARAMAKVLVEIADAHDNSQASKPN